MLNLIIYWTVISYMAYLMSWNNSLQVSFTGTGIVILVILIAIGLYTVGAQIAFTGWPRNKA